MKHTYLALIALLCSPVLCHAQLSADGATASFKGSLPPKPSADISPEQQASIEKRLAEVTAQFQSVKKHARAADADIFLKAVRFALEFHEWYDKTPEDSVKKANALLDEAAKRIESLEVNMTPWMEGSGVKVLGFYSNIDDSPQPYGVEVPEGLEWGTGKKSIPMWVWLHGRGDTATDIHFIASQMKSKGGQFKPKGTIVVHPFGRYCNGFKSAGETDVMECKADATARFNVDINRIALAGFSMGGAGAWHLGAHYADQWAVVHTGAGFVDVKRYQKLTPEKMPPWYEQTLWGVYDVPDYAANFRNVPLISYSGEIDSQRDGAEYMTEVLAKEGITRPHLIGPGMGHKYHPEVIKEVQRLIEEAVAKGRDPMPKKISWQGRCARYGHMFWLRVSGLNKIWEDARVEGVIDDELREFRLETKNVCYLDITKDSEIGIDRTHYKIRIDGNVVEENGRGFAGSLTTGWGPAGRVEFELDKVDGQEGPIDEAYMRRFVLIPPDKTCANPEVDRWVRAEYEHFIKRWRGLMRGDPIVLKASNAINAVLDETEIEDWSWPMRCVWGDPTGNSALKFLMERQRLPFEWDAKKLKFAGHSYKAKTHVPVMTLSWLASGHSQHMILNSGLTFREAHDKTNSLQNPKLPDWAILDITQPPNAESAGKVVAADFFDEHWQVKSGK